MSVEITAKGLGGTVVFDGCFVTIKREGFFARSTVGKGEKRIPLGSIHAVQWKAPTSLNNGFIAFTIAGGIEKQSRFGSQYMDAAKDENAVVFKKKDGSAFEALREAIEGAIAKGATPISGGADEVARLAELHAAGHISDEEFTAAKAKALGL